MAANIVKERKKGAKGCVLLNSTQKMAQMNIRWTQNFSPSPSLCRRRRRRLMSPDLASFHTWLRSSLPEVAPLEISRREALYRDFASYCVAILDAKLAAAAAAKTA